MTDHPILVVGGTGKTGGRVAARLRDRGDTVRVGSRSGERRFDWNDRSTWEHALEGTRAVYVVPFDGAVLTRPFVERAEAAGVERLVLLSGRGVDVPGYADPDAPAGATHIDGESAVRASALSWTILRPGWFAQNFSEGFFRDAVLSGELRLPAGDGAASFVDADDIADVAVAALTGDGHAGRTYELSGPRALTIAEAAAEISAATGRPLRYVPLSPDAFVTELTTQGWPESEAKEYADVMAPIRLGLDAHLSDGVRQALGRAPRDFTAFARTAATSGAWG
ncbi:NAD(P)H-binding protein [Nonomuraea sp. NPDC050643]|uniref:NAD(P)H-binding protein n=1 Tax=Nonomuraea sp. NPDC050643 TaxID=3155660 RepID=UPI0033D0B210